MIKGVAASEGIGIGCVKIITEPDLTVADHVINDPAAEKHRLADAVASFCEKTNALADETEKKIGRTEADIIRGHVFMISDPYMISEIEKLIDEGKCAERALQSVCDMFSQMFSAADDEVTRQRATDVGDIKMSVLKILMNIEETDVSMLPEGSVLVADDLTPSMTVGIDKEKVVGIITQTGGQTSHSAILARALGIPAVLGAVGAIAALKNDETVIVNGSDGVVLTEPDSETVKEYTAIREQAIKERESLKSYIGVPSKTKDGRGVELFCNIGSPAEAKSVVDNDGEGVGLFRTEFLFMDKNSAPSEEEQFDAYKKAVLTVKGRPMIVRTLDVGGDKDIPYLGLKKEENPFLGFRAIRYCLKNEELYKTQLRALIRASAFGDIRIMVPMITRVDELLAVRNLVSDIMAKLDKECVEYDKNIKIGIMIETPAAVMIADKLAKHADFFSIGTNDLTQYTMVADRGNNDVAYLYSPLDPAVLCAINRVIKAGHENNISVGMCGEAAGDRRMIPLLLAMGLDEFSISPSAVLKTRSIICNESVKDRKYLLEAVLNADTVDQVKSLI